MDEQGTSRTRNKILGDVSGSLLQAGTVNADQLVIGSNATGHRPGFGSAAVPWGRLEHHVRGRTELTETLTQQGAGAVVLLHGGGGYGKTTIALAVARVLRDEATVWWVDATSAISVSEGLREVAIQAGADVARVKDAWAGASSAPELLWQALNSLTRRWLLVVDNADDSSVLAGPDGAVDGRGWLRTPASTGMMIITSRDGRPATWTKRVMRYAVGPLDEADGAAMLLDLAPHAGDHTAALGLARRLGGLPLALRLASGYLTSTAALPPLSGLQLPRTFAEYGAAWDKRLADITVPTDGTVLGERELLGRTWELSLDLLVARGMPLARPMLRLVSFLAAAPIPYPLLDGTVLTESALFPEATAVRLAEAIAALIGLGLLEHQAEGPDGAMLSVHPVIRDSCRWQADAVAAAGQYEATCIKLLDHATRPLDWATPEEWSLWRALLPHCQQYVQDESAAAHDGIVASLAHRAARYTYQTGLEAQADGLFRFALDVRMRLLGPEHPATLAVRNDFGCLRRDQGDLAGARAEFDDVLAVRERILGGEHPATLVSRHNVARMLREQGDLAGAADQFQEVIAARERVLGAEHPYTVNARYEWASVLHARGELSVAAAAFREIEAVARRTRGAEHPATLAARYKLACVGYDQGDPAETEFRDLLVIQQRVLGADYPLTIATHYRLGCLLHRNGDLGSAAAEFRHVISTRERLLGRQHAKTLAARYELARVRHEQGEPVEAEFLDIHAICTAVLADTHPLAVAVRAAIQETRRHPAAPHLPDPPPAAGPSSPPN